MKIASFTMIGQFPHGIDLHVRNLRWALDKDSDIYIVTLPEIIADFDLKDGGGVHYIPFRHEGEGSFINFWAGFPALLKKLDIHPAWYLFMEEDIWFHRKPGFVPGDVKEIANYLPLQTHYHAIAVDGKTAHARVWEGGTLMHGGVVERAIESGINFSFATPFFFEKEREKWEAEMGGKISLRYFSKPDTFDEVGLYCALVEKTKMCHFDRCVHLRGPESLHRQWPGLYDGCTDEDLVEPQKKLPYFCMYGAVAPYYIAGNWKGTLDWSRMEKKAQAEFVKLLPSAGEWMREDEYARLREVTQKF